MLELATLGYSLSQNKYSLFSFQEKIINLFLTFNFTLGGAEGEKNADKDDKFLTRSHPSPVNYFLEKFVKKGVANFRT